MSNNTYHVFIFSYFSVTKAVNITEYSSGYMRMMKVWFCVKQNTFYVTATGLEPTTT